MLPKSSGKDVNTHLRSTVRILNIQREERMKLSQVCALARGWQQLAPHGVALQRFVSPGLEHSAALSCLWCS